MMNRSQSNSTRQPSSSPLRVVAVLSLLIGAAFMVWKLVAVIENEEAKRLAIQHFFRYEGVESVRHLLRGDH